MPTLSCHRELPRQHKRSGAEFLLGQSTGKEHRLRKEASWIRISALLDPGTALPQNSHINNLKRWFSTCGFDPLRVAYQIFTLPFTTVTKLTVMK